MRARYIIPAVLAFFVGLLTWQIQKERLALEYDVVESAPFPRGGGTGKYFIVRIQNTGNAKLDRIEFHISFDSDVIESSRFAEPALVTDLSQRPSALSGSISLLNPDEFVSVTITTFGQAEARVPTVTARAPGATARPRSDSAISRRLEWMGGVTISVGLAVALVSLFVSYRSAKVSESISKIENLGEVSNRIEKTEEDFAARIERGREEFEELQKHNERQMHEWEKLREDSERRMRELEKQREDNERRREQGEPEREQMIFAVMNRAGLAHKFIDLATGSDGTSFWRTGLFLMHGFLVDETNRDRYVSAMEALVDLPLTTMAPSSKGFNLYLLAKMEQYRHNSEAAIRWFERCRTVTPLMYEHLMAQDPAFDLDAVRRQFTRG